MLEEICDSGHHLSLFVSLPLSLLLFLSIVVRVIVSIGPRGCLLGNSE